MKHHLYDDGGNEAICLCPIPCGRAEAYETLVHIEMDIARFKADVLAHWRATDEDGR